jgi:hypothetical protein
MAGWSEFVKLADKYHVNAFTVYLGLVALYLGYLLIYGFFLCPTRHIPGPFLTRFTYGPYYILLFGGKGCMQTHTLHEKYGTPDLLTLN